MTAATSDRTAAWRLRPRARHRWLVVHVLSAGAWVGGPHRPVRPGLARPLSPPCRSEAELAEAGTPFTVSQRGDYPGIGAFLRVDDAVFRTYSTFGRGIEEFHYGIP